MRSTERSFEHEYIVPFTRQFSQRIGKMHELRESQEKRKLSDPIEARKTGNVFYVSTADQSRSCNSSRTFGFVRALSAGKTRDSSKNLETASSVNNERRSASSERVRRNSDSHSVVSNSQRVMGRLDWELQQQKDLLAKEKQKAALLQVQKESYLKNMMNKGNTPWLPYGDGDKNNLSLVKSIDRKTAIERGLLQKAWRRSPWPGHIPDAAKRSASAQNSFDFSELNNSTMHDGSSYLNASNEEGMLPENNLQRQLYQPQQYMAQAQQQRLDYYQNQQQDNEVNQPLSFPLNERNENSVNVSVSGNNIRSLSRPPSMMKINAHLAKDIVLTVTVINSSANANNNNNTTTKSNSRPGSPGNRSNRSNSNNILTAKAYYGILRIPPKCSKLDLIGCIERQFNVLNQISDIVLVHKTSYVNKVSVTSLAVGTLSDEPNINEHSNITIYLNGTTTYDSYGNITSHNDSNCNSPCNDNNYYNLQQQQLHHHDNGGYSAVTGGNSNGSTAGSYVVGSFSHNNNTNTNSSSAPHPALSPKSSPNFGVNSNNNNNHYGNTKSQLSQHHHHQQQQQHRSPTTSELFQHNQRNLLNQPYQHYQLKANTTPVQHQPYYYNDYINQLNNDAVNKPILQRSNSYSSDNSTIASGSRSSNINGSNNNGFHSNNNNNRSVAHLYQPFNPYIDDNSTKSLSEQQQQQLSAASGLVVSNYHARTILLPSQLEARQEEVKQQIIESDNDNKNNSASHHHSYVSDYMYADESSSLAAGVQQLSLQPLTALLPTRLTTGHNMFGTTSTNNSPAAAENIISTLPHGSNSSPLITSRRSATDKVYVKDPYYTINSAFLPNSEQPSEEEIARKKMQHQQLYEEKRRQIMQQQQGSVGTSSQQQHQKQQQLSTSHQRPPHEYQYTVGHLVGRDQQLAISSSSSTDSDERVYNNNNNSNYNTGGGGVPSNYSFSTPMSQAKDSSVANGNTALPSSTHSPVTENPIKVYNNQQKHLKRVPTPNVIKSGNSFFPSQQHQQQQHTVDPLQLQQQHIVDPLQLQQQQLQNPQQQQHRAHHARDTATAMQLKRLALHDPGDHIYDKTLEELILADSSMTTDIIDIDRHLSGNSSSSLISATKLRNSDNNINVTPSIIAASAAIYNSSSSRSRSSTSSSTSNYSINPQQQQYNPAISQSQQQQQLDNKKRIDNRSKHVTTDRSSNLGVVVQDDMTSDALDLIARNSSNSSTASKNDKIPSSPPPSGISREPSFVLSDPPPPRRTRNMNLNQALDDESNNNAATENQEQAATVQPRKKQQQQQLKISHLQHQPSNNDSAAAGTGAVLKAPSSSTSRRSPSPTRLPVKSTAASRSRLAYITGGATIITGNGNNSTSFVGRNPIASRVSRSTSVKTNNNNSNINKTGSRSNGSVDKNSTIRTNDAGQHTSTTDNMYRAKSSRNWKTGCDGDMMFEKEVEVLFQQQQQQQISMNSNNEESNSTNLLNKHAIEEDRRLSAGNNNNSGNSVTALIMHGAADDFQQQQHLISHNIISDGGVTGSVNSGIQSVSYVEKINSNQHQQSHSIPQHVLSNETVSNGGDDDKAVASFQSHQNSDAFVSTIAAVNTDMVFTANGSNNSNSIRDRHYLNNPNTSSLYTINGPSDDTTATIIYPTASCVSKVGGDSSSVSNGGSTMGRGISKAASKRQVFIDLDELLADLSDEKMKQ